jgi:hypothetical protein
MSDSTTQALGIRAFSYGGGVQSSAALVLAAERTIDYPTFLFANVGNDSENPATLAYVEGVAKPYALTHGIELVEVAASETLMTRSLRIERSVMIPVRMAGGAPGNRQCTQRFKIAPVAKELRRRGATKERPATLGLGISIDEYHRVRSGSPVAHEVIAYPLIDLRLDRQDCQNVITKAGLPVPPKSSCFFCPFQTLQQWQTLLRNDPESFEAACVLEEAINEKRVGMGRDRVWLSGALRPLREAVTQSAQLELFAPSCDIAGYCHG